MRPDTFLTSMISRLSALILVLALVVIGILMALYLHHRTSPPDTDYRPLDATSSTASGAPSQPGAPAPASGSGQFQKLRDPAQIRQLTQFSYAPFVEEEDLAAEEEQAFLGALQDHFTARFDLAFPGGDPAPVAPDPQKLHEIDVALQDQLKTVLGDDRYARFTEYRRTLTERNLLRQVEQELANTEMPLSPEQKKNLWVLLVSAKDESLQKTPQSASVRFKIESERLRDQIILQKIPEILSENQASVVFTILQRIRARASDAPPPASAQPAAQ